MHALAQLREEYDVEVVFIDNYPAVDEDEDADDTLPLDPETVRKIKEASGCSFVLQVC
jgi:hypothetical protein